MYVRKAKIWGVTVLVLEKKCIENLVFLEALVMLGEIGFIAINHQVNGIQYRFKVTLDLRGCPPRKNLYATILKESTANYVLLETLRNVDFGIKKKWIARFLFFLIPQKKIAKMTEKMTMHHSVKQVK